MLIAILAWLAAPVDDTNAWAASVIGLAPDDVACADVPLFEQPITCPDRMRALLDAVADRESPGNFAAHLRWVGRHRGDSWAERSLERKGLARGILQAWCPFHVQGQLSTVGPHGLIYTYNVARADVPGNCWPSIALALPRVSSLVAAVRVVDVCTKRPDGWCPSIEAEVSSFVRRVKRRLRKPA